MPVFESRPYRTASPASVNATITLLEPDVDLDSVSTAWVPGAPIKVGVEAAVSTQFWEEAGVTPADEPRLVISVMCAAAKATWRASEPVVADRPEGVSAAVEIDGEIAAGELLVSVWIAGPGRTGAGSAAESAHRGAKLWELPQAVRISPADERSAFPITVVSFLRTGRPSAPWLVETSTGAEPTWTVDAGVRLYLNNDMASSAAISTGTAEPHIFDLIRADIRTAVIEHFAGPDGGASATELEEVAEEMPESMAGLAVQSATAMGLSMAAALNHAREKPSLLAAYARESTRFYRGEAGA